MKRRYLAAFVLTAVLALGGSLGDGLGTGLGYGPITVHAVELGAEGTAAEKQQEVAENVVNVDENKVPMAVLAIDGKKQSRFPWGMITIVGLSVGIVGTGVWAVVKSRSDKTE